MNYDDGRVKIVECPLCSEVHEYDVHLITKPMQVVLTDNREADRMSSPITAKYYCPCKDEEFEQEVNVIHRFYEMLRDMKTRLVEEDDMEENEVEEDEEEEE